MMFFNDVFRFGASPDSSTITPPSPDVINWSLRRDNSLLREDTLEPTVTKAVGIHPLDLDNSQNCSLSSNHGSPYVCGDVSCTKDRTSVRTPESTSSRIAFALRQNVIFEFGPYLPPGSCVLAPTIAPCRSRIAVVHFQHSRPRSTREQMFVCLIALGFRQTTLSGTSWVDRPCLVLRAGRCTRPWLS